MMVRTAPQHKVNFGIPYLSHKHTNPSKNIKVEKMLVFLKIPDCIGPYQEISSCAPSCLPKCNNYPGIKCPPHTTAECVLSGCVCEDGYAIVEPNKCAAIESKECGGLHDPLKESRGRGARNRTTVN